MERRRQSQRLGYPSVVSIFQNLSKEKRHDLAEKNTFFNKLDNRTPYHLGFVGHIVFDTFLRSRKLCHLITIAKLQMYSFFFTTEYLPLSFRHWLRRKLDHNDGINRDNNSFFNRIGTVINYLFVKYNANSPDLRTTVPLMINNLIINFNIRDEYVPNFFKKLGQSIIRNLDINSETLLLYFYEEDLMQTVFGEMTTLTVQNVRVFALMVPPVSLERFWKMRAQTMELHDEFASRQCFINVCEDLRSGKVPFNRFQYTGYFRMTRDHFGGFWDRLKDRMGFGVDDDVRVNGNSICFKTSDSNLIIKLSFKKLLFPSNSYQLSAKMGKEIDDSSKFQLPATVSCFLPKAKRIVHFLFYDNIPQVGIVLPLIIFLIIFLFLDVVIAFLIMSVVSLGFQFGCVIAFYLNMRLVLVPWL